MTIRAPLLALLLCAPGLALAQDLRPEAQPRELRSGPGAPAVSSQLPPSIPPGNAYPGPEGTVPAPGLVPPPAGAGRQPPPDPAARIVPPPDHRVLGGPALPGAERPESSTGFTGFLTGPDVIPPNVGERVRPEAPTTGTGRTGETRR